MDNVGWKIIPGREKVPVKPPVGECLKQGGLLWPKQGREGGSGGR